MKAWTAAVFAAVLFVAGGMCGCMLHAKDLEGSITPETARLMMGLPILGVPQEIIPDVRKAEQQK